MSTEKRFKRGDLHPDGSGRVFWQYLRSGSQEWWMTKEAYENKKTNRREYMYKWKSNPVRADEVKGYMQAYQREYRRRWYVAKKNKERRSSSETLSLRYNRIKERRASSPLYSENLRMRALTAYAAKSGFKFSSTCKTGVMLGCDGPAFKVWIESSFLPGMSWKNRHLWHLDHKIPLSSARDVDELMRLFNHKNVFPMWAFDNRAKGSRL